MIRKIVSAGQTGVELAALDIAIKLGIAHGGWTSRGRHNEDGRLPEMYRLEETSILGFQEALRKNVSESDGTLVISRGKSTPHTKEVVRTTLELERQLLHIDLSQHPLFEAASLVSSWMAQKHIKIVHVTGLLSSEDPAIYDQTRKILETAFYLGFIKSDVQQTMRGPDVSSAPGVERLPQTVSDAVKALKATLTLKDRTLLANMQLDELDHLRSGLGEYIKQHFGLYAGNQSLLESCAQHAGLIRPLPDEACAVILRALWEDLGRSHKLRVVK